VGAILILTFLVLWVGVSFVLGVVSGWFRLMRAFPNRSETAKLTLKGQSGRLGKGLFGGVAMSGILNLSVCPSGLRVGKMRLFGLFSRDFLVPWGSLTVVRHKSLLGESAELRLGSEGALRIDGSVANRLARGAGSLWPEPGPFPEPSRADAAKAVIFQWLLMTTIAGVFFTVAPLAWGRPFSAETTAVAVAFPALIFGISAFVQYRKRIGS